MLFHYSEAMVGRRKRGVAQFGSALGSGPRGRGFKSRRLDQKNTPHIFVRCVFCIYNICRRDLMVERVKASLFLNKSI